MLGLSKELLPGRVLLLAFVVELCELSFWLIRSCVGILLPSSNPLTSNLRTVLLRRLAPVRSTSSAFFLSVAVAVAPPRSVRHIQYCWACSFVARSLGSLGLAWWNVWPERLGNFCVSIDRPWQTDSYWPSASQLPLWALLLDSRWDRSLEVALIHWILALKFKLLTKIKKYIPLDFH